MEKKEKKRQQKFFFHQREKSSKSFDFDKSIIRLGNLLLAFPLAEIQYIPRILDTSLFDKGKKPSLGDFGISPSFRKSLLVLYSAPSQLFSTFSHFSLHFTMKQLRLFEGNGWEKRKELGYEENNLFRKNERLP